MAPEAPRGPSGNAAGVDEPPASDGSAVAAGIFGLADPPEDAAVVLVPSPWEATATYGRGTALGPEAIARASDQVDLLDLETGQPYLRGIAMLPSDPAIVAAQQRASALVRRRLQLAGPDSACPEVRSLCAAVDEQSRWLNERIRATVSAWLDRGKLVGLVGGDHSCAWGSIAAHAARYPALAVLQIDAHADLRVAYQGFAYSHASVMHQVLVELPGVARLVSVGVRDLSEEELEQIRRSRGRVRAFFDVEIARRLLGGEPFARIAQQIASELPADVYVSFDIDGLEPALCPHTGTPVPGGLSFHQLLALLAAIVDSGRRLVGFDLCEVAPGPAGDEWDANVGARVLYKLIGQALRSWPS